jgi:NAD(P)-dependent dehydrogenase (short-subunit alcohol dehydrogenase family)
MRFALVTGTSSGIGLAVARGLLERGWQVLGVSRRQPASLLAVGAGYSHLALDLADASSWTSVAARVGPWMAKDPERIGLVNNAADGGGGRAQNLDPAGLARHFTLNAAAPLWLMGLIARTRPQGAAVRVVNVSSGAATRAIAGLSAYCASKAALRMAGMTLAEEVEGDFSIVSYGPGVVDTAMQAAARSRSKDDFPSVDLFKGFHAEGRLAPPEAPAQEIIALLEAEFSDKFNERRRA